MIIAGGNDTINSPQQRCPAMARTGPAAGEYEYIVMPDLGHNFDAWWERNYNAEATADAYERLIAFLGKHLSLATGQRRLPPRRSFAGRQNWEGNRAPNGRFGSNSDGRHPHPDRPNLGA